MGDNDIMPCADANSCKAAGVMRRARLADLLHKQTVSVLRGGVQTYYNECDYYNR